MAATKSADPVAELEQLAAYIRNLAGDHAGEGSGAQLVKAIASKLGVKLDHDRIKRLQEGRE